MLVISVDNGYYIEIENQFYLIDRRISIDNIEIKTVFVQLQFKWYDIL